MDQTLSLLNSKLHSQVSDPSWSALSLVILIDHELFFILRNQEVPSHKGQVAFIGGHRHMPDEDPYVCAKREFAEETHLDPQDLHWLGFLPSVTTQPGKKILPLVAQYPSKEKFMHGLKPNTEWSKGFLIPWQYLQDSSYWTWARMVLPGGEKKVYYFPLNLFPLKMFNFDNKEGRIPLLWGASAQITWSLIHGQPNAGGSYG